ncbi:MAG: hypothetical protein QOC93_2151 [Actinomycetota bacterium]|jgi:hypothetical protein|nr:hypothetical protein [Actinomycetota bacterium]
MNRPVPVLPPLLGWAVESAFDTARASARDAAGELVRWSVDRILPDGGQRTARRNAWAAMGVEARHARDRREAEAALHRAARRAAALAVHPSQGTRAALPDGADGTRGATEVRYSV